MFVVTSRRAAPEATFGFDNMGVYGVYGSVFFSRLSSALEFDSSGRCVAVLNEQEILFWKERCYFVFSLFLSLILSVILSLILSFNRSSLFCCCEHSPVEHSALLS